MNYEINIKEFSGPLDLLLHLIKKSNINIYDISIDEITKQYLLYIEKMEEMNLNIASEYLVMAAELIEMKSSYLLPKQETESDEIEEDPKENLIKRLLEYEQYKNMSDTFKSLESIRHEVYTKLPDDMSNFKDEDSNIDYGVDLNDLVLAFSDFIKGKELAKPLNTKIANKEYSIKKRCLEIRSILKEKKKVYFTDLFDKITKEYVVITFLSILSLSKNQEIILEQENNFKNIIIKEKGVL